MSTSKDKPFFGSIKLKWSTKADNPTNNPTQPSGTPGSTAFSREQASSPQARTLQHTSAKNAATPPVPTIDSAPTAMVATSVSTQDGSRRLNCLIEGESIVFSVTIGRDCVVSDLKKEIKRERALDTLKDVGPHTLELWKVNIDLETHDKHFLRHLKLDSEDLKGVGELASWKSVEEYWSNQPPTAYLHIIIKILANVIMGKHLSSSLHPEELSLDNDFPFKCARMDNGQQPHTPPSSKARTELIMSQAKATPPRLNREETEAAMNATFEPFEEYIEWLATGKLDGYLDSIHYKDRIKVPNVDISNDLSLLLHDIGKFPDEERIKKLFINDTIFLFNTSGAGKTRLSLEGLCDHWGIYLTCQSGRRFGTFGSSDFQAATSILTSISTWDPTAQNFTDNIATADRVFAMLLCARVFIFQQLLAQIPKQTDVRTARRRWVLLQSLPGCYGLGDDIFAEVLRSLRRADTDIMRMLIRSTLEGLIVERKDLFPLDAHSNGPLFLVIDEAQVAADSFKKSFRPHITESAVRPILHAMYRFLQGTRIFRGTIISGTGLSTDMVMHAISSLSAKRMGESQKTLFFTDIGLFHADQSQIAYVRHYLTLSDNDVSDQRLMERIQYWFSGRPRTTASLIELLLYSENPPKHRVLTAFVRHLTGFTITDAEDLEDKEAPISAELTQRIQIYGQLTTVERLFEENDKEELLQCLIDVLMRWVLGSQPTAVKGHMHDVIALGVGHLKTDIPNEYNPKMSYPVFIDEPLAILALSSLFERQTWSKRREWIVNSFRTSRNASSSGFILEEVMLLVLMQHFGGKFTALGDVFHFSLPSPLASRKVTLVALKRTAEGVMQCCPASWNAGGSDRFGFKAKSPTDVVEFLNNPKGKPFLFPDNHMGPDLTCFLQDEQTKELILLVLQSKIKEILGADWQKVLTSIDPEFFYTITKDEKRSQYAPLAYPDLSKNVAEFLRATLGPEAHKPVVATYRSKLRSSARKENALVPLPTRQIPRYLRVIAAPDDEHQRHLEAVGDSVAVLKWTVVEEYTGLTADIMRQPIN